MVSKRKSRFEAWVTLHTQFDEYSRNIEVGRVIPGIDLVYFREFKFHIEYIRLFDNTKQKYEGWLAKIDWRTPLPGLSINAGTSDAPETASGVSIMTSSYFGGLSYEPTDRTILRLSYAREDRQNSYIRHIHSVSVAVKF